MKGIYQIIDDVLYICTEYRDEPDKTAVADSLYAVINHLEEIDRALLELIERDNIFNEDLVDLRKQLREVL